MYEISPAPLEQCLQIYFFNPISRDIKIFKVFQASVCQLPDGEFFSPQFKHTDGSDPTGAD